MYRTQPITNSKTKLLSWVPAIFLFILPSLLNETGVSLKAQGLTSAPTGTFSIVVIPDTQRYETIPPDEKKGLAGKTTNPTFELWTEWISKNLREQNIVFVSHVGDIVDINNRDQWTIARRCMDKLHGKVPYGISVGNHDMKVDGNSKLFQEFFPKERFIQFDWYAGCYENPTIQSGISTNNANSVQLFEAAGMNFIGLHLECNAPDNVLRWANSVLDEHKDRRAIITTHMGLGPRDRPVKPEDYFDATKGRMTWTKRHGSNGNSPQQMWEKCFSKHGNVFMICSGDQSRTQAMRAESIGLKGNTVHELLSDYGKSGLRIMRFIPFENRIEVRTYDPINHRLCNSTTIVKDIKEHQFNLSYTMDSDQ